MDGAEVVIVGAGVVGASIAHHLASAGCREVTLLERASRPGTGSTSRATGGFRAQFGTAINVRLSILSRQKLLRFGDEIGGECGFESVGYLFLAETEGVLAELDRAREVQRAAGCEAAERVGPEDIARLNPALDAARFSGGTFSPEDGFIRPRSIHEGYLESARRLGARVVVDRACTGLRIVRGRVAAVETNRGPIACGSAVIAAGPWAGVVGGLAGVPSIPVEPLRRQVAITEPFGDLPPTMPMTIVADDGFHFRVRDGRVLLLRPSPGSPRDPFDDSVELSWIAEVTRRAREVAPALGRAVIATEDCWAGLYEMSPDGHALLGPVPALPNLYLAVGSSGHGVMHAPALGHLLAEIMLEGTARTLDVRPLRPERFAEGEPVTGSVLL